MMILTFHVFSFCVFYYGGGGVYNVYVRRFLSDVLFPLFNY